MTISYKLAEKLSERLDEMGKDLTSMIEEVNGASSTLTKTNKADEPVCHEPVLIPFMWRIFCSHISIDLADCPHSQRTLVTAAGDRSRHLGLAVQGCRCPESRPIDLCPSRIRLS